MIALRDVIRPGMRVALADGIGAPLTVSAELSQVAREVGGVRLLLGWMPWLDEALDLSAFEDVTALMPGWGVRRPADAGLVRALPLRWSTVPALLNGPLRPEVLIVPVVPRADGTLGLGTEVSWMLAARDAGAKVLGIRASGRPDCSAEAELDPSEVTIIGEDPAPVASLEFTAPDDTHRLVGEQVARLVPAGSRIQVGPGALGTAILDAITEPVLVDSGLIPDAVVDLDARGLLLDTPVSTYLAGSRRLVEWAASRRPLRRVEYTHDLTRLSSGTPFLALNTAIEIDLHAQVNVETAGGRTVSGPGGLPDYAAAAARSVGGLSIIALPAVHDRRSALVDRLSGPVSTVGHDVDVVVTEHGSADLRGLTRTERADALAELWSKA